MKPLAAIGAAAVAVGIAAGVIVSTPSDTPQTVTARLGVAVPTKQTFYYQVSAVNAVGEGTKSNEVKATIVPLTDFQKFVTDSQAAAYYAKWAHDNPGDLARWTAYRDSILSSGSPSPPAMNSNYGRALVDAGVLFLDYALSS